MDARESATARWTAILALAVLLVVQIVYCRYWASTLPINETELAFFGGADRWRSQLAVVFGLLGTFMLGQSLMHDTWCGTALALGHVLFPPVVATYALGTFHGGFALGLLLLLIGANAALRESKHRWGRVSALALFAAALLFCISILRDFPAMSVGSGRFLADAVFPYSMLWVGAAMSALALCSAVVRNELGKVGIVYAVGGFTAFAAVTVLGPAVGVWQPAEMTTALTYVFPLGVLGFMPLIVWVRRVMPTVKSMVAWIAFPVIMYSCFWVVLGPVKVDRYPYALRSPQDGARIGAAN